MKNRNIKLFFSSLFILTAFAGCDSQSTAGLNTVNYEPEVIDNNLDLNFETYPIYFTTMTHMESNFKDDENEDLFLLHVDQIRWAIKLFDEYGVKLTIESEQSFATANSKWDLNILKEVVDSGHGVGTHADFGGQEKRIPVNRYTMLFEENKTLIDDLVGEENNKGVSGGQGQNNWLQAAADAGFKYMDGVVGFAMLAIPEEERPANWTDEYIRETGYHDSIPLDLEDRIYPFGLADLEDFEPDNNSILTISDGGIGEISSMYEGRSTCSTKCELAKNDIDEIFKIIDEAITLHDPSELAKLNIHIPLLTFAEDNEEILRYFLKGLKSYQEEGVIEFATQLGAYEAYMASQN